MIRWGIIGCGDVTEVKSGPALQKVENSSLVAVMRRTGHLAEDYARRHNVPKWYDSAADLIEDPEVDAVYIATPPNTHAEYTLQVAQAGKPVYVEKPMARNFAECQAMLAACEAANVPLFVAYYRRMLPRFLKVKALLDAEAIGRVCTVEVHLHRTPLTLSNPQNPPWRVVPNIAGGGLFVDLAAHTLDFLDYALGPIAQVSGHASNQASPYPAEDTVTASFVFESGVQGIGVWSFTSFHQRDEICITGTKGQISLSTFGTEAPRLETQNGFENFPLDTPLHVQQPLINTLVQALHQQGTCPSTGQSAARTNWVMDEILAGFEG